MNTNANPWIISDTHFNHANIIKLCSRPFKNVEEMNGTMLARWNEVVEPSDTIVHVGDFAFGVRDRITHLLSCLNGHKILILGNHDRNRKAMLEMGFDEVYDEYTHISNDGWVYYFTHRPLKICPDGVDLVVHGHTHEFNTPNPWEVNVSVEKTDYRPIQLSGIRWAIEKDLLA